MFEILIIIVVLVEEEKTKSKEKPIYINKKNQHRSLSYV